MLSHCKAFTLSPQHYILHLKLQLPKWMREYRHEIYRHYPEHMLFVTRLIIYLGHEIKWENALTFVAAKMNAYSTAITHTRCNHETSVHIYVTPPFYNFYQFHLVWISLVIFPLEYFFFFKDNMIFTSHISWNGIKFLPAVF